MDAEGLWYLGLLGMGAVVAWIGCWDLWFYWHGQPTISDFLRENPKWVVGPMAVFLSFFAALLIHIFIWHE